MCLCVFGITHNPEDFCKRLPVGAVAPRICYAAIVASLKLIVNLYDDSYL